MEELACFALVCRVESKMEYGRVQGGLKWTEGSLDGEEGVWAETDVDTVNEEAEKQA